MNTQTADVPEIEYPDDDGEPMSDTTLQFDWITKLKDGFDGVFRDDPAVFVAGNLLWYPVEGDPKTRVAPDAMVAFGRPKGYRGSYKQWKEGGVAPQVVFEVMSPSNDDAEMERKPMLYERFGVEEFYIYDPLDATFRAYTRDPAGRLKKVRKTNGFTSPRLGVRFDLGDELIMTCPDGRRVLTYLELVEEAEAERQRAAAAERQRAATAAEAAAALQRERAAAAEREAALRAKLRAAGIDPDGG
jgi:Uma2 family endonuclease